MWSVGVDLYDLWVRVVFANDANCATRIAQYTNDNKKSKDLHHIHNTQSTNDAHLAQVGSGVGGSAVRGHGPRAAASVSGAIRITATSTGTAAAEGAGRVGAGGRVVIISGGGGDGRVVAVGVLCLEEVPQLV